MKLLADENVHKEIVAALRSDGHDVLWVVESGLAGSDDITLLELARSEGRIIITSDKDFGELVEFDTQMLPVGIILLRYRFINIARIIRDLRRALQYIAAQGFVGKGFIIVLEETRMRVRKKLG